MHFLRAAILLLPAVSTVVSGFPLQPRDQTFEDAKTKGKARYDRLTAALNDANHQDSTVCNVDQWFVDSNKPAVRPRSALRAAIESGIDGVSTTDANFFSVPARYPKNPDGTTPNEPKAQYLNLYNIKDGAIVAQDIVRERDSGADSWSDVSWLLWRATKERAQDTDLKNLKYIIHTNIQSEVGLPVLNAIYEPLPAEEREGMKTWSDAASNEFLALLGTENGSTVLNMLITRKNALGSKTIKNVNTLLVDGEYHLWWEIG